MAKKDPPTLQWMEVGNLQLGIKCSHSRGSVHVSSEQRTASTQSYVRTYLNTSPMASHESSYKHGRRHKAVPTVDIGTPVIVVGVAVCADVGRWHLVVPGVVPARGGSRVIMLPVIIVVVSIQVLPRQKNSIAHQMSPCSYQQLLLNVFLAVLKWVQ